MKCLICEKELQDVNPNKPENVQPYDGGEISFHFHFGSKYDWMGYRQPCYVGEPGKAEITKLPWKDDEGNDVLMPVANWSEPIPEIDMKDETTPRATRLAACSHIRAMICDDCFKAKAHLIDGYEKRGPDEPLEKVL